MNIYIHGGENENTDGPNADGDIPGAINRSPVVRAGDADDQPYMRVETMLTYE
jgi:hypothetical protein